MAKEKYILKVDNVKAMVKFVNPPKDEKKGFSYTLNIKDPIPELKSFLDKYNGIKIYTFDKQPRIGVGQEITIAKFGITQWVGDDGKTRYSGHIIHPEDEVFKGTKPISEPVKTSDTPKVTWKSQKDSPTDYSKIPPDPEDKIIEKNEEREYWEAKERRMVRMNSLSHAVEVIKLFIKSDNELTPSELSNLVMLEAEIFEQWIYEKKHQMI